MKTNILYKSVIFCAMSTALLYMSQSCQKHYDMVPPPVIQEDDDLDDEIIGTPEDYFVTLYGDGEMDGSSWENALDADGLIDLLTGTSDLSKCYIHVCEGTYYLSSASNTSLTLKKNVAGIFGGYSSLSEGTDTGNRNTAKYPTVFSGDLNGDGTANEGDCGLMTVNAGHVKIDGITFEHGYITETAASAMKNGSGFFVDGDAATTILELSDCIVRECISGATTSNYAGGAVAVIMAGQIRMRDVLLIGNESNNRGGAIRCCEDGSILMLDRCLVKGNYLKDLWGHAIQMSGGNLCMNNCTIYDNTSGRTGAQINGGGSMLIINSTVVGVPGDNWGAIRCESYKGSTTRFINNVLFSQTGSGYGFYLNGNNEAASFGFNVYDKVNAVQMLASDKQYTDGFDTLCSYSDEENVFVWIPSDADITTYATADQVIEAVTGFNPQKCPVVNLGSVFADWCTSDGFSVDARGSARNPGKLQPGAYDACLQ